ncbi:MAG: ArsA family ATPase [Gemmatimonadaceae bacterium]
MSPTAATTLVRRLPRTTLVVGKGGVGKTTAAAALALESSRAIGRTLVVTTDPARALPTVLDHPVGADAAPLSYAPALEARLLDAAALRARFMERWSRTIALILDRGTYLDDEDIGPLVDTALPGSDEIFAALELAALIGADEDASARIIVDTAPTGHTLRLLNLPGTFRALVRLLDTMQGKHRVMVRALARGYERDEADAFLEEMSRLVGALEAALVDPERCAAVMITKPGTLVQEETRRYLDALMELHIAVSAVIWNGVDEFPGAIGKAKQFMVPVLDPTPVGREGLERWLLELAPAISRGGEEARRRERRQPQRRRPRHAASPPSRLASLLRPLTIVAGKGGVGKTTVAAALALQSARHARTLVVSTDPAPSLADAFAQPIADEDTPVGNTDEGRPLFARQMDASAAFARLRERYRARVDALFDGLVGRGMDLSHDRAIVRDLMALAPPGVDEVYALSLLSDALFAQKYERVIVDPAPTGHLLRLLDMPRLALAWSHQLMRLMLKYKEIGGLGEAAADVLAFARDLRALEALLHDPARAGVVIVTLDERVVAAETTRLANEITGRGIAITGIVLNKSSGAATFPLPDIPVQLGAPVSQRLVGTSALARWSTVWT